MTETEHHQRCQAGSLSSCAAPERGSSAGRSSGCQPSQLKLFILICWHRMYTGLFLTFFRRSVLHFSSFTQRNITSLLKMDLHWFHCLTVSCDCVCVSWLSSSCCTESIILFSPGMEDVLFLFSLFRTSSSSIFFKHNSPLSSLTQCGNPFKRLAPGQFPCQVLQPAMLSILLSYLKNVEYQQWLSLVHCQLLYEAILVEWDGSQSRESSAAACTATPATARYSHASYFAAVPMRLASVDVVRLERPRLKSSGGLRLKALDVPAIFFLLLFLLLFLVCSLSWFWPCWQRVSCWRWVQQRDWKAAAAAALGRVGARWVSSIFWSEREVRRKVRREMGGVSIRKLGSCRKLFVSAEFCTYTLLVRAQNTRR